MPERRPLPGLPYSILHFQDIDSTSRYLRAWGRQFPENGLVVSADYQTAGRGRLGRSWHADRSQALCFSLLIAPVDHDTAMRIPLIAAVVLYDTLLQQEHSLEGALELKWPNDLLIRGKKAAGILTELETGEKGSFVVLGVGLNCNQREFPQELSSATSLQLELGHPVDRTALLERFLRRWYDYFENRADRRAQGSVVSDWKARSRFWNNEPVQFALGGQPMRARTRDLAPSGALVVLLESGEEKEIISGDVDWIRRRKASDD